MNQDFIRFITAAMKGGTPQAANTPDFFTPGAPGVGAPGVVPGGGAQGIDAIIGLLTPEQQELARADYERRQAANEELERIQREGLEESDPRPKTKKDRRRNALSNALSALGDALVAGGGGRPGAGLETIRGRKQSFRDFEKRKQEVELGLALQKVKTDEKAADQYTQWALEEKGSVREALRSVGNTAAELGVFDQMPDEVRAVFPEGVDAALRTLSENVQHEKLRVPAQVINQWGTDNERDRATAILEDNNKSFKQKQRELENIQGDIEKRFKQEERQFALDQIASRYGNKSPSATGDNQLRRDARTKNADLEDPRVIEMQERKEWWADEKAGLLTTKARELYEVLVSEGVSDPDVQTAGFRDASAHVRSLQRWLRQNEGPPLNDDGSPITDPDQWGETARDYVENLYGLVGAKRRQALKRFGVDEDADGELYPIAGGLWSKFIDRIETNTEPAPEFSAPEGTVARLKQEKAYKEQTQDKRITDAQFKRGVERLENTPSLVRRRRMLEASTDEFIQWLSINHPELIKEAAPHLYVAPSTPGLLRGTRN